MPTTLTLMAQALSHQLQSRGYPPLPQQECEAIMGCVLEGVAAMGEKMEREDAKT